jgi:hypothetical protein
VLLLLKNTVVASGTIWAGVPVSKKSKTLINLILLEKSNVSNNYVMYSGWFKDEE